MHIKNRLLAQEFRIALIIFCFAGIFINLVLADSMEILFFYTIQINIITLIFFAVLSFYNHTLICRESINGEGEFLPRLKRAVSFSVIIAGLFFHFIVSPAEMEIMGPGSMIVHYIVPAMCVVDWLLFDKKGQIRWFEPFLWLIIPIVYVIFSVIRAQIIGTGTDGRLMPYFFLDYVVLGTSGVLFYIFIITTVLIILGEGIYLVDKLFVLGRKTH